jgi:hypothetical protein
MSTTMIATRHRPAGPPHLDGAPDDRATFPASCGSIGRCAR